MCEICSFILVSTCVCVSSLWRWSEYMICINTYSPSRESMCWVSITGIFSENFSQHSHPGGSTNTSRFGGRYETGGYESELWQQLCLCLDPVIIKSMAHTHQSVVKLTRSFFSSLFPSFCFFSLPFFSLWQKMSEGPPSAKRAKGEDGTALFFLIADDGSAAASCMQNSVVFGEASMVLQQPCPF